MRLLFKDALQAASDYNADVESYKEGMKEYYSKTIRDELMLDCLKMVSFSLYAKGRKACGKLIIKLSFEGDTDHVFIADSRQIKKGKHDVAPEKNDAKIRDAFDFFFPNDQEEYEYGEWNLIRASKNNSYSCAELISGNPNNDVIPSIYLDTRFEQTICINWKINGTDIPEKGRMGSLKIVVLS